MSHIYPTVKVNEFVLVTPPLKEEFFGRVVSTSPGFAFDNSQMVTVENGGVCKTVSNAYCHEVRDVLIIDEMEKMEMQKVRDRYKKIRDNFLSKS